jgi:hypothetical protein
MPHCPGEPEKTAQKILNSGASAPVVDYSDLCLKISLKLSLQQGVRTA